MSHCLIHWNKYKEDIQTSPWDGLTIRGDLLLYIAFSTEILSSQALGWLHYMHTYNTLFRIKWAKFRLRVPNVLCTKDERLSIHSVAPFSYSSIMQVYRCFSSLLTDWLACIIYHERYVRMESGSSALGYIL